MRHTVGTTPRSFVEVRLEPLHYSCSTDCTQALTHHVEDGPRERHFPCQEQPQRDSRIDVTSCKQSKKLVTKHIDLTLEFRLDEKQYIRVMCLV